MFDVKSCGFKSGYLPECAPLALSYTPMQQSSKPAYEKDEALIRGTLFPGLDLPFMNIVNTKNVSGTPLGEVQAICFVAHELQLYLDTHPNDREAFEAMKSAILMAREAKRRYVEKYGPLCHDDLGDSAEFDWLSKKWPWNYMD